MITVVSAGYNAPTKARCMASVASQKGAEFRHTYVEASEQTPRLSKVQNVYDAISNCPPDDVIVLVDGDDWLAHDRVLEGVARMYENPDVWLTYGSFVFADGRPGFAAPLAGDPRKAPWTATHLKTFRAGLYHRVEPADLDGLADDQRLMVPMLEMAGPHARFTPEITYVYNFATSLEFTEDAAKVREVYADAERVRAMRPYPRLEAL